MAHAATGSLESLRDANRRRVLEELRRSGTASRAELARATGLSRSTVSNVVSVSIQAAKPKPVSRA